MHHFYRFFAVLFFLAMHAFSFAHEVAEEKPAYLYKILSYDHWQASENRETVALSAADDAFIHFSIEDQLDKIIAKYWSGVSQFVVLKIDTDKLEGELVYETNPGGSAKYYHLYRGAIPISAIEEVSVGFQ